MTPFSYQNDRLYAESLCLEKVAQQVGTPSYVYSHSALTEQWQRFKAGLQRQAHRLCFAVKANSNLAILNTLATLGAGFDIVSKGELQRVIAAKGDPRKVIFSGVGKQADEIDFALKHNIECFNVESEHELETLHKVAQHNNKVAPIAFRLNPDIQATSHPYITTGHAESKFGLSERDIMRLFEKLAVMPHSKLVGIACHIGSQITSLTPFVELARCANRVSQALEAKGATLEHLNLGGGLGVSYATETPPTIEAYLDTLITNLNTSKTLILEPGRSMIAHAGILLLRIIHLKRTASKHFCIVDGAMNDFSRPMLYDAKQRILPLTLSNAKKAPYDIVGPVCESGDFLAKDVPLAVKMGEYLALCDTGAYGFVMSSNYNSRPRACEVMIKGDTFKVVRQRETLEQLYAQESLW